MIATMNISVRLRSDFFSRSKSLMPSDSPTPMIGPMIGEMSIAPMMTAAELTFSPSDAIIVAKISTQRLTPRNSTPFEMAATTSSHCAWSSSRLNRPFMNSRSSPIQAENERRTCCVLSVRLLSITGFSV